MNRRSSAFLFVISLLVFFLIARYYGVPSFSSGSSYIVMGIKSEDNITTNYYRSTLCNCDKEVLMNNQSACNPEEFHWCSLESSIRGARQNVIAYSVYGSSKNASIFRRYFSLLKNISATTDKEYPGWVVRIYHNLTEDGDKDAYQALCSIYCQNSHVDLCSVPVMASNIVNDSFPIEPYLLRGLNPRMWRFLAMLDSNVNSFISRDIDSLILWREVEAVEQWLESHYTFHLMRDHPHHTPIILAGMWGAKVFQKRDLFDGLARALVQDGQDKTKNRDQTSLEKIVWPTAKYDVMAHDSYHCQNKNVTRAAVLQVFPFPTKRRGQYFVGGVGPTQKTFKCPLACRPPSHQDWEYC